MGSIRFKTLPAPERLKADVECFVIAEYSGTDGLAIKTAPAAVPAIVFHHQNGRPAIERIVTPSGGMAGAPTLFLAGPGTEPSVMNFRAGAFTTMQVILKPQALQTLLGLNALALAHCSAELDEFSGEDLNDQLMHAHDDQERTALLSGFLWDRLKQAPKRDELVEESLRLIHANIGSVQVRHLLDCLAISERQFERRFSQTVGLAPQAYIRVKRFNEAVRLMKTGQYARLTDVAQALNFHDQSHFIRDVKEFSGLTPTGLLHQDDDFYHGQSGYSYR